MIRALLLVALLLAGCAAPRPGQTAIHAGSSDAAPVGGAPSVNPSGRTGAPIGPPPSHGSTPGPTQRAASRPAPVTVRPSPEPSSQKGGDAHDAVRPGPDKTAADARTLGVGLVLRGTLAHMGMAPVGPRYAAIPWGPGIRVRICAARCVTVVSADTGPSLAMQRAGRVADVSVELFERICGRPASAGLCQGTVSR